ncbi:Oxidoreductase-like domain-containing protein [Mycena indigotica]|uniref:Oxidoreductase-like domain-containing protein n=1 Tax=Mycena indigotica TaxID=2126181 RepID=A0A8H6SRX1_9AGAR|nr:Oxidoreductase-like domain-containing protein [Mycena indigotica]KAF7303915.1 Oxidoreductase-like domain-containing protein [Mycena indigotica]
MSFLSPRRNFHLSTRIRLKRLSTAADDGAVVGLHKLGLKWPLRGGQNLSLRYRRLEQSLRGKAALKGGAVLPSSSSPASIPSKLPPQYFYGLKIPQKPQTPASDECCMSGCAVCVYDLYDESLANYQEAVASFRDSLRATAVPESEWPIETRGSPKLVDNGRTVVQDAFDVLERTLAAKRQGTSAAVIQHQTKCWTFAEMYEGVRWVLFARR